ncbi:hypothetical protein [Parvularcula maris]|uniref:Uncharacterized protein n=1 Tax=Parvularcula maris TaxID=2965077 RepID=A0A9X2L7E9_9PROT|nr:hypothetical protein [Parvularcula maris]MCQ8184450.1 hypothetical protein [Parvularcula maris]
MTERTALTADAIAAADDPDAAADFLKRHPARRSELCRAAEAKGASAVLFELDRLASGAQGGSTDTPALELRLQGHSVVFGRDHAYLMVIVDDHPAFDDDPRFARRLEDGRRYATLGAGPRGMMPIFSTLVSGVNRAADLSPLLADTFDLEIQHPDVAAGQRTERDVVDELFAVDEGFSDELPYDILPFPWSDGYNSNSYISGLLQVTGWEADQPGRVPGWTKPVPAEFFTGKDQAEDEAMPLTSGRGKQP